MAHRSRMARRSRTRVPATSRPVAADFWSEPAQRRADLPLVPALYLCRLDTTESASIAVHHPLVPQRLGTVDHLLLRAVSSRTRRTAFPVGAKFIGQIPLRDHRARTMPDPSPGTSADRQFGRPTLGAEVSVYSAITRHTAPLRPPDGSARLSRVRAQRTEPGGLPRIEPDRCRSPPVGNPRSPSDLKRDASLSALWGRDDRHRGSRQAKPSTGRVAIRREPDRQICARDLRPEARVDVFGDRASVSHRLAIAPEAAIPSFVDARPRHVRSDRRQHGHNEADVTCFTGRVAESCAVNATAARSSIDEQAETHRTSLSAVAGPLPRRATRLRDQTAMQCHVADDASINLADPSREASYW